VVSTPADHAFAFQNRSSGVAVGANKLSPRVHFEVGMPRLVPLPGGRAGKRTHAVRAIG
jgi:hypothetical protein